MSDPRKYWLVPFRATLSSKGNPERPFICLNFMTFWSFVGALNDLLDV